MADWFVLGLTIWLNDLWLVDWLTDWLWVYWVMHWLTEIVYDWLYYIRDKKLTEWCNSDLKAAEAYWPMHSLNENTESIVLFAYCCGMNGTQSKYDCTQRLSAIQIKFHDHCWLFHQSLMKKLVGVRMFFRQLGTRSSGRCRCREVETRVNVWTVPWDKKVAFIEWWPLWRGGPWWRIDCILLLLADCVKYWRTNYCLIGILTYWLNNWLAYWRRLGFYFTEWMTWLDSTVWLDCMFLLVDFFICCELYGEVLKSLVLSCNSISRRENGYKLSAQRFLGSFKWTSVSF